MSPSDSIIIINSMLLKMWANWSENNSIWQYDRAIRVVKPFFFSEEYIIVQKSGRWWRMFSRRDEIKIYFRWIRIKPAQFT